MRLLALLLKQLDSIEQCKEDIFQRIDQEQRQALINQEQQKLMF